MSEDKKSQIIFERIDQLFKEIFEEKNMTEFENFLNFLNRMPQHSPFNNALVFAQKPECFYYATARQWRDRFGRDIKKDARPLVILFPFAPIEFVYDLSDTEGEEVAKEELLYWWREEEGEFNEDKFIKLKENCERINFSVTDVNDTSFFYEHGFHTMGVASSEDNNSREILLHPRYKDKNKIVESYGVLCHEVAHQLLGHLGGVSVKKRTKKGVEHTKDIVLARKRLSKNVRELEAELVAWIVFDMFGIQKRSVEYMANWLIGEDDLVGIDMAQVLKVAGNIKNMSLKKVNW